MHNFTINGKNVTATWKSTITEQEAQEARELGNASTLNFGMLEHDLTSIKTLVQKCVNFQPNVFTADAPATWVEYEKFAGETEEFNPKPRTRGIKVIEFTAFWNMVIVAPLGHILSCNIINAMLNDKYGDSVSAYTVHCFNENTLQPIQPILFSVTQTGGGQITITVTDGSGDYEYSLDNQTWQEVNIFNGISEGLITVYVRDSENVVNSRTFTITST